MGNPPPLRVETPALNWKPAVVTVPPVPVIPPGPDPMSTMISAIMPELAAPLTAAVAETQAREQRFAADLASARAQYETTDNSGEAAIRTVSETQMAPASAATAGSGASGAGTGGQFGQLMGTAMQMAGQATQAPAQVMGMAAQAPQAVMQAGQGAVQQIGQIAGQVGGKPEGDGALSADGARVDLPVAEQRQEDESQGSEREGGAEGPADAERAPEVAAPQQQSPVTDTIDL